MKIKTEPFRIREGRRLNLRRMPTRVDPLCPDKETYRRVADEYLASLQELQEKLYADGRYALLIVFQAMDAAGKDSAIKHVMSGVNPQGCQVVSFKQPSAEELDHDFLWRTSRNLPRRGCIGIFNRSYYEEVLVARVHPEILENERLPEGAAAQKDLWKDRYRSIVEWEKHLHRNGTRVVKFFLHLSKEEQRKRFLDRLDRPEKNWKFSLADIRERARWNDYQDAYEECLSATSTDRAPWYAVPADHKKDARLILSRVLVETLRALPLRYPQPGKKLKAELRAARESLLRERD